AASRDAVNRLLRMGEERERIHLVGAPGLDEIYALRQRLARSPRGARDRLRELLKSTADQPYALIVQHPAGRSPQIEARVMRTIMSAVEECGLKGVILYPNSDPGHSGIIDAIASFRARVDWCLFRSLPRDQYLCVAMGASVMVGNSSSGIIESAS